MVWAGEPFAQKVEFITGTPVGDVSYALLGNDGSTLLSATITPASGALSCLLPISGANNTCANDYLENRTLTWNYATADGVVADRVTYRVDKVLPLAISANGVRAKLGLEAHELGDDVIDLVTAYAEFVELVGDASAVTTAAAAGDRSTLLTIHAVEALAGLFVIRSLQLRAAQSESSGTNEYKRFGNIDWRALEDDLLAQVAKARGVLDPTFDETGEGAFTFGTAPRGTDAVTGA